MTAEGGTGARGALSGGLLHSLVGTWWRMRSRGRGLTLAHFSALPESSLLLKLHSSFTFQLNLRRFWRLTHPHIPQKLLTLSRNVEKCEPLAGGGDLRGGCCCGDADAPVSIVEGIHSVLRE